MKFEDTADPNIFLIDGEEEYDQEGMLAYLLSEEILFCNSRRYLTDTGEVRPETIVLFLNCSDTFAWGCADAEEVAYNELPGLYKLAKSKELYGITKWVCKKRNLQPQRALINRMKETGKWDSEMESLRKNSA